MRRLAILLAVLMTATIAQVAAAQSPSASQPAEGLSAPGRTCEWGQVVIGSFSLGDWETAVHVKSDRDYLLYISAINVDTFTGAMGIQLSSTDFYGSGQSGPGASTAYFVPGKTTMDLGPIGGNGGETISLVDAGAHARTSVILTVVTCQGANVTMDPDSIPIPGSSSAP